MTGLNGGDGEGTVTDTVLNYLENRPVPVQVHNVNNSGSIELEYTVLWAGINATEDMGSPNTKAFTENNYSQKNDSDIVTNCQVSFIS